MAADIEKQQGKVESAETQLQRWIDGGKKSEAEIQKQRDKVQKEKDKLDIVKTVQEALIKKGYRKGKATGYCGTDTVAAVKAFQKANNLTVDGQAGTKTLQLLLGY